MKSKFFATLLNVLRNHFDSSTKLFSHLYLSFRYFNKIILSVYLYTERKVFSICDYNHMVK